MQLSIAALITVAAAASQLAAAAAAPKLHRPMQPVPRAVGAQWNHDQSVSDSAELAWKHNNGKTDRGDLAWKPQGDLVILDDRLPRHSPSHDLGGKIHQIDSLEGKIQQIEDLRSQSQASKSDGIDDARSKAEGKLLRVVRRATGPSSWLECEQRWFGTAPFCDGSCPPNWTLDRRSPNADGCYDSVPTRIRTGCFGLSSSHCFSGSKALCEGNCWAGFADGRPKVRLGFAPPPRPRA